MLVMQLPDHPVTSGRRLLASVDYVEKQSRDAINAPVRSMHMRRRCLNPATAFSWGAPGRALSFARFLSLSFCVSNLWGELTWQQVQLSGSTRQRDMDLF